MGQVVAGDGIGHGNDRAFAGGIGEAVRQACRTCDGSHIQDYTTALSFMCPMTAETQ